MEKVQRNVTESTGSNEGLKCLKSVFTKTKGYNTNGNTKQHHNLDFQVCKMGKSGLKEDLIRTG